MTTRSALLWLMIATSSLLACGKSGKSDTERPTYSISTKVLKKMAEVREDLEKKEWDGALAKLDAMGESSYLNPYEKAAILGLKALTYSLQEKPGEAIPHLQEAVALDAMPMQEQQNATYNLGYLLFLEARFSEAADVFAKWEERVENPEADEKYAEKMYVIASSFAQAKRFKEALPRAEKAIAHRMRCLLLGAVP